MKAVVSLVAALAVAATLASAARAQETFRCDSGALVSAGLSTDEVLEKCGEPQDKKVIEEPIRARNAGGGSRIIGTTIVERWTYSRAQGQFPALLHVEEGRVKRIEFLTRN